AVLAAKAAGLAAIRPGVRMCDVDAAARKVLRAAGMAREFSHSLGHGLGLDIHEAHRLSKRTEDVLEPGMVVTVEPGVYFAGIGGRGSGGRDWAGSSGKVWGPAVGWIFMRRPVSPVALRMYLNPAWWSPWSRACTSRGLGDPHRS